MGGGRWVVDILTAGGGPVVSRWWAGGDILDIRPTAGCRRHRKLLAVVKEVEESLVASDFFTADHRQFLARMVVTAEPPEVTTCRTPAYLLPATDSPPGQPPHFRANFCQFHRRYAGPPPNYALCDQGIDHSSALHLLNISFICIAMN